MKTFDKKDIFTCMTADEAIAYIGNNGYFANSLSGFNHIDCFAPYSLDEVQIGTDKPFVYKKESYALFLPADKVKEVEEKKWRPFEDFNEFKFWTGKGVGSVIVYKDKLTNDELEAVITRSKLYENFVEIGAVEYTFKELFDQWEWLSNRNKWQPFGVEE